MVAVQFDRVTGEAFIMKYSMPYAQCTSLFQWFVGTVSPFLSVETWAPLTETQGFCSYCGWKRATYMPVYADFLYFQSESTLEYRRIQPTAHPAPAYLDIEREIEREEWTRKLIWLACLCLFESTWAKGSHSSPSLHKHLQSGSEFYWRRL